MSFSTLNTRATARASRNLRRHAAACLLIASGLVGGAVNAADQPPSKSSSKPPAAKRPASEPAGKPLTPLLTREQLRSCMNLKASNQESTAEVQRMQPEILAEKAELQRSGETMKAELAALDRTSPDAIKDYSDRALARDEKIGKLEAKINDFNAKVNAIEAGRATYARDCDNRRYDEKDEKALLGR